MTFTCFRWLNLFEITNGYQYVYKWFHYLATKGQADVVCYVIMPNHVHLILHIKDPTAILNTIIANGKRFIAYSLVQALQQLAKYDILDLMYYSVNSRERNKGQRFRVFEKSFDAKPIYTDQFLYQKIDYIHHNPLRGKWRLVDDFVSYTHSSASYYETGRTHFFEPVHFNSL